MVEQVLPDAMGSALQGIRAGAAMTQIRNQNKLADLGPGLAAGDPNALAQMYAIDPMKALELQSKREGLDMRRQEFEREQKMFELQLEEFRRKSTAEEKAAEAEQLKRGIFAASAADTPEQWDETVSGLGLPHLVGKFDMKDAYLRQYMTAAEILEADAGPEYRQVTGEEAAGMGLDPSKAYNVGADGKITAIGGGDTNINVNTGPNGIDYGEPEKGLVWARNPDGTIRLDDRGAPVALPYKGGSVYTEQQAAEAAAENAGENRRTSGNIVLDEIDIARQLIGGESAASPATGITGSLTSFLDTTRGGKLKNRLDTIKANIGFDKLQAMRDASPTGGALGQVSEFENRLLQAVYGSLEQAQTAEDLLYNLGRIEDIYSRVINEGIPEDEARELYRREVLGESGPAPDAPKFSVDEIGGMNARAISDLFNGPGGLSALTPEQRMAARNRLRELTAK